MTNDKWRVPFFTCHFFYCWQQRVPHALSLSNSMSKSIAFLVGYRATSSWYDKHELQETRQRGYLYLMVKNHNSFIIRKLVYNSNHPINIFIKQVHICFIIQNLF